MLESLKNPGTKIIEHLCLISNNSIHLKKLARDLKISPGSVKRYCDTFVKDKILISEREGNLRKFKLNNSSIFVKKIKSLLFLKLLIENAVEKICENEISLAIYGSIANGEYDQNSDIDILILTQNNTKINATNINKLEKILHKEIQITKYPYYKWEKDKNKCEPFIINIIKNHILIKGDEL